MRNSNQGKQSSRLLALILPHIQLVSVEPVIQFNQLVVYADDAAKRFIRAFL